MAEATRTTDHEEIKKWAEQRGGRPAKVEGTEGLLRIDFREPDENLEEIPWSKFFEIFDENDLAFLYQAEGESRFNKFVNK